MSDTDKKLFYANQEREIINEIKEWKKTVLAVPQASKVGMDVMETYFGLLKNLRKNKGDLSKPPYRPWTTMSTSNTQSQERQFKLYQLARRAPRTEEERKLKAELSRQNLTLKPSGLPKNK